MALFQPLMVIFSLVALGFFCGKKKRFTEIHTEGFELFLFKIALPCSLFHSTLHHELHHLMNLPYIFSYLTCFSTVALITTLYFQKTDSISRICIKILASGYVNTAIYTLPIITILIGDPKAGIISNILQVVVIQSIFLSLLNMHTNCRGNLLQKIGLPLLNPLIIMPMTGLTLNYFHITVHAMIVTPIMHLGSSAFSIALFTFGLGFSKFHIHREIFSRELVFLVFMKNIIHPLLALLIGKYIFCLERYWLISLIISSSAPTAYIVYVISKKFSIGQDLVKSTMAVSSMLSLLSLVLIAQLM